MLIIAFSTTRSQMRSHAYFKCILYKYFRKRGRIKHCIDSTAVSIFVVILVELTSTNGNKVFVKSTIMATNIETVVLSSTAIIVSVGKHLLRCYPDNKVLQSGPFLSSVERLVFKKLSLFL